jgi:hypothetical protein
MMLEAIHFLRNVCSCANLTAPHAPRRHSSQFSLCLQSCSEPTDDVISNKSQQLFRTGLKKAPVIAVVLQQQVVSFAPSTTSGRPRPVEHDRCH